MNLFGFKIAWRVKSQAVFVTHKNTHEFSQPALNMTPSHVFNIYIFLSIASNHSTVLKVSINIGPFRLTRNIFEKTFLLKKMCVIVFKTNRTAKESTRWRKQRKKTKKRWSLGILFIFFFSVSQRQDKKLSLFYSARRPCESRINKLENWNLILAENARNGIFSVEHLSPHCRLNKVAVNGDVFD